MLPHEAVQHLHHVFGLEPLPDLNGQTFAAEHVDLGRTSRFDHRQRLELGAATELVMRARPHLPESVMIQVRAV